MKRFSVIFLFILLLSSCSLFGNHTNYRDITVTNNDIELRVIDFLPTTDNKTGGKFSLSIASGETKVETISGPYIAKSKNENRYYIDITTMDTYVINPVQPNRSTYNILNTLSIPVTLKDTTYPDWQVTVPSNDTKAKEAQLYNDETHAWYLEGSQTENTYTYLIDGSNKVFYTLTVECNQIIISAM